MFRLVSPPSAQCLIWWPSRKIRWVHPGNVTLHEGVLARQLLELGGGHEACMVEQQGFVGRRRDAHHRAYLGVRDFAAPERIVDRGELGELVGDAHALPGRDELPADPPRQPVCTRQRTLDVPAAALIERAQIRKEPVHGCIEVCGMFCDSFAELLQITVHGDCIASDSDMPTRIGEFATRT